MLRMIKFLAAVLAVSAMATSSGAAVYQWDAVAGGDAVVQDGTGTWSVAGANWYDRTAPTNDQNWADGHHAIFGGGHGGTAGTVTITGTVNAASVTLNDPFAGNYTLEGTGVLNSIGSLVKNGSATATLGGVAAINPGGVSIKDGKLVIETTVASTDGEVSSLSYGKDLEIKGNGSLTVGGAPQFLSGNITLRDNAQLNLCGYGNFELDDGTGVAQPNTLTILDNATFTVDRDGAQHGYDRRTGLNTAGVGGFRGAGGFCYGLQWNQYSTVTIDQQGGTVNLTNPMDGANPWGPGLVLAHDGSGESAGIDIDHRYDLSGGVLNVSGVINVAAFAPTGPSPALGGTGNGWAPVFNFDGGTMRASQSDSTDAGDISRGWNHLMGNLWHAYVKAGGAIIDTDGHACSINQPLEHDPTLDVDPDGGLLKLGTGTLTLLQTNTYTGPTVVTNGTLRLTQATCLSTNTEVYLYTEAALYLDFDGAQTVHALYVNGVQMANGTWGSSASRAAYKNDTFFDVSGSGILTIGTVHPGTILIIR